jgi:two-component system, OmpR family, sensor histidine kinase KdpD
MTVRADRELVIVRPSLLRRWLSPITASAGLLAATTVLLWAWDRPFPHEHLIYIYFVPTALIAIRYGSVSAMLVTIGAIFAAAFFFYAPRFSLAVESPLDVLELIFFSMLALLASRVVSGFANDRDIARRRRKGRWPSWAVLWARAGR